MAFLKPLRQNNNHLRGEGLSSAVFFSKHLRCTHSPERLKILLPLSFESEWLFFFLNCSFLKHRLLVVWFCCITFQSLHHVFSGVGQNSSILLQLRQSITCVSCLSTCPTGWSLVFKTIQLLLQRQQVLQTPTHHYIQEDVLLTSFILFFLT